MKINMMRFLIAVTSVASIACGRAGENPQPASGAAPEATANAGAHPDAGIVRVDPGMLRDLRITTASVESRLGAEDVTLLGELSVDERRYAEVGAPIAARVMRLLAAPGDAVREGTVLAELQSPEVGRARSDYVTAESRAALAEQSLKRKRDLAAERIVPQREVEEAEATATEARSAVRAAAAALEALGVPTTGNTSVFSLRSPVSGTVIDRDAMRGQMIEPATAAFRIADLSTLWLTVHAFERDAVRIIAEAPARILFPALPGQEFTGNVALLGREVDATSHTVPVRIDVRNRSGLLRPGMSASAFVPVGASQAPILTVPVAAVQRVRDEWCVFIPKDPGTFEIRVIGRGRDLGGEVEVLSGLTARDTIVVDGAFLLKSQAEKSDAGHDDH